MRTLKVGRSAITGKFKTVKAARRDKDTSIVATIKVPTRKAKLRK